MEAIIYFLAFVLGMALFIHLRRKTVKDTMDQFKKD